MIGRIRTYFIESWSELKKVTWPGRQEVYATTVVVLLTTIFFGFYLYGLDLGDNFLDDLGDLFLDDLLDDLGHDLPVPIRLIQIPG